MRLVKFALAFSIGGIALLSSGQQSQPQQSVPDAPSATRPANQNPLGDAPKAPPRRPADERPQDQPPQQPSPTAQQEAKQQAAQQELYKFSIIVNSVIVPVAVKDSNDRLVDGLLKDDFAIYEDGVPQRITYFSSEAFPLVAAVLIDTNMPDSALRRVREGLDALAGAFSQYDQVAVYTYGGSVQRLSDFDSIGRNLDEALAKVQKRSGSGGGVPVTGGPMVSGPSVNGAPYDRGTQATVPIIPRERHVLNDAIFQAALDLSRSEKSRRRMIFVISDGHEYGSRTSYADALKTLLGSEIQVYAIGTDAAAIPVYNKLERLNVPFTGVGDILPKYSRATGGQVFERFGADAIQNTYAEATLEARNQYTLGYTTRATAASNYRQIEVVVHRHGLKVLAKDGYYPLPPASNSGPPHSQ
jgi:VWFA-related protein